MLNQNTLRALLDYDQSTGVFLWRFRPAEMFKSQADANKWNAKWAGSQAGYAEPRGVFISLQGKNWRAHRLVFLYVFGWVPQIIDHADGDPHNNKLDNLRQATRAQNKSNSKPNRGRKFKGVYLRPSGRYVAVIRRNQVTKHIGTYATAQEAAQAYDQEAVLLSGPYARTNKSLGLLD